MLILSLNWCDRIGNLTLVCLVVYLFKRFSPEDKEHLQVYLRVRPFTTAEIGNGESQVKIEYFWVSLMYTVNVVQKYSVFNKNNHFVSVSVPLFCVFNRRVLLSNPRTQSYWSLPVCPRQSDSAWIKPSHRLDNGLTSLGFVSENWTFYTHFFKFYF